MKRLRVVALVAAALGAYFAGMVGLFEEMTPPRIVKTFSTNWAGYEARGRHPTMVSASWTVPPISSSRRAAAVSTWIGIGGTGHDIHLLQVGTGETTYNGILARDAWLELWPALPQPLTHIGEPTDWIVPGDHVSATICSAGRTRWIIQFSDATQGWTFATTVRFTLRRARSAEWVTERPQHGLLPRFTPAHFTHLRVARSGGRPVAPHHLSLVQMIPMYGSTVTVGPVRHDAFTDSYVRSS